MPCQQSLGGMTTSMCTWSGIGSPSIILVPMYSQNILSISPISLLPWLYMTFLLNFGMSTMRRLHIRYTHGRLKSLPKKRPRR